MPDDKVWLRRGIRLTAIGMSFPAAYAILSLIAVVAAWFGKDISYLSVTVAPRIAALGVPEFLIAISIVSWGPRLPSARQWIGDWWSAAHDYLKLRPLWRALRKVDPNMVHSPRTLSERFNIEVRVFWRVIEINDWLERLRQFYHPEVSSIAGERAREKGLPGEEENALIEAAQIMAALRARAQGRGNNGQLAPPPNPAPEAKIAFVAERTRLVSVARALELD